LNGGLGGEDTPEVEGRFLLSWKEKLHMELASMTFNVWEEADIREVSSFEVLKLRELRYPAGYHG